MIELVKRGGSVDLLKKDPTLDIVNVALAWGVNNYKGQEEFDLDVSVFGIGTDGRCKSDDDMVFYQPDHLLHKSGAIKHSGDERSGAKDGDDEVIQLILSKMPSHIDKIVGVVTIYDAKARKQNFGQVPSALVRIDNASSTEKLFQYDLSEDFGAQTAIKVFEIYRHSGTWKFKAVGVGYEDGLAKFVEEFGLAVSGERK